MEYMYDLAIGKIETEISTPEKHLEKYEDSLWNNIPMPEKVNHRNLRIGETEDLRYSSFEEAKAALLEAYDNYETFFAENPGIKTKNAVFGNLDKFHWDLLSRKHYYHHFKQFGLV